MGQIEVYVLDGCPFCRKVLQTLKNLDLSYTTHEVPEAKEKRDEVERISGQREVPVIIDHSNNVEGMNGSEQIVEYLRQEYSELEEYETNHKEQSIIGRFRSTLTGLFK